MFAARKGYADCVEMLASLEKERKNSHGQTALMEAANNGHSECVQILAPLEQGTQDNEGKSALMFAAKCGDENSVRLLLDDEAGMKDSRGKTALMFAAVEGYAKCVNILLEKEKNMLDNDGHNARWHAIGGCKEILANVEECMDCKDLFDAVDRGCEKCCKGFIDQAGTTTDDIYLGGMLCKGRTALMVAAYHGKTECVKTLA